MERVRNENTRWVSNGWRAKVDVGEEGEKTE